MHIWNTLTYVRGHSTERQRSHSKAKCLRELGWSDKPKQAEIPNPDMRREKRKEELDDLGFPVRTANLRSWLDVWIDLSFCLVCGKASSETEYYLIPIRAYSSVWKSVHCLCYVSQLSFIRRKSWWTFSVGELTNVIRSLQLDNTETQVIIHFRPP